jgi:hypothetical protein
MAYIKEKITKSGLYYYLVESRRVNGRVEKHETYIGTNPPKGINRPSLFDRVDHRLCPECRIRTGESIELCPKCEVKIERLMNTLRMLKDKGIRGTGLPKK